METPQPKREPGWRDIFLSISLFSFQVTNHTSPHRTNGKTAWWVRLYVEGYHSRLFFVNTAVGGWTSPSVFRFCLPLARPTCFPSHPIIILHLWLAFLGGLVPRGQNRYCNSRLFLPASSSVLTGLHRRVLRTPQTKRRRVPLPSLTPRRSTT